MTSNSRIDPSMQNPSSDRYTPTQATNSYSPSVPISVYRELAAELQTAQTMLVTLKSQNQQLVKQNQQLRQEVEKVVQSAQHLQQIVASFESISEDQIPRPKAVKAPEPRPVPPTSPPPRAASAPSAEFPPPPPQEPEPTPPPYRGTVVIEQEDGRSRRTPSTEGISEVNGWLLVVAIMLIVLTAFGGGFLVLRSLLGSNSR